MQSVVDLDYFSRVNAFTYPVHDFMKFQEHLDHCSVRFWNRLSVPILFHYASAFPSVARK